MAVKFTNNAATTLAAGINSSATSIAVTDGSVFPTITGSDHFYVTFDDTTNKEIVKVTARSGNTLTVVRGHDNTTARAFSSGDKAELRIVAALLDDVKTEVSSTLTVDTFTGNGSATAFTLSVAPASEDNLIVFIEGVYQNPGDFTLSGTTLTLDVAPANSRKIIVYHVASLVSGNNLTHNQFTCNGSTTAFTLGLSPIHENNTQVFLDGVYQQKTDYAVSGTTLTMDTAPANGAILEVMTFTQTEVNTLPASFVSGLTQVTAVGADHFMIFDATDSALKKSLVSDVLESATSISTSADATAITIDSNEKVTFTSDVTTGGHLEIGGSNNELRFYEGSNYVGFEAPALTGNQIWVLPAADGSNGQIIKTDGSGNLSFADEAGGVAGITSSADATAISISSGEVVSFTNETITDGNGSTGGVTVSDGLVKINTGTGSVAAVDFYCEVNNAHRVKLKAPAHADFSGNVDVTLPNYTSTLIGTNSSGNVGIGATTVDEKIHVEVSSGDAAIKLEDASNDFMRIDQNSVGANDKIRFKTGSGLDERMRIDSSGRVGIGTNAPGTGYGGAITAAKLAILSGTAGNDGGSSTLLIGGDDKHYAYMQGTHISGGSTQLDFGTANGANNPTLRMRIDSSGRVGIGTATPTSGTNLDVQGGYIRSKNVYMGTGGSGSKFEGGNGSYEPGTGNLLCGATNLDLSFLVVKTGVGVSVQAKVDSPSGDFFTNDGSVSSLSDERVKTDITDLGDGLEIVKQLRPVTFKYNDTSEDHEGNKRLGADSDIINYGFIAQEVEKVAPHYVKTGVGYINNKEVNDFRSMSTTRMIPMLFKAIQELEARVKELES